MQRTVLLVEDSRDTREALAQLFEMQGYRVAAVANGLEALDAMLEGGMRPDVIVLDLIMPSMDGMTFHEQKLARAELRAIPVLALTGHEGLRRHALDAGFAAALLKPCDIDELLRLVAELSGRAAGPTGVRSA